MNNLIQQDNNKIKITKLFIFLSNLVYLLKILITYTKLSLNTNKL